MIQFTHEVAFYGLVKLDGTAILATSGSIGVSTDPMFSSGVWGAGWYTAAEQVSYALNFLRIEGDVSFELAAGDIFTKILNFAFEKRVPSNGEEAMVLDILPQGKAGYSGPAYCSGCNFSASEGSIVTGGFNYSSGNMGSAYWKTIDPTNPSDPNRQTGTKGSTGTPPAFKAVYPYWATAVLLGASYPGSIKLPDVVSWDASYTSSIEFVKFCQGITDDTDNKIREADYIMVGPMNADGNFTIFTVNNQISPEQFHSQKACRITMLPGNGLSGTPNKIDFANIVYNSGNTSVQTGGAYCQADVGFSALGDGTKPPMLIS